MSFAEIFLRKSVDGFEDANYSSVEAYRYSTLAFFGGFLMIFILDRIVHYIIHCLEKRATKSDLSTSQSQTVLLNAGDAASSVVVEDGEVPELSLQRVSHDMESQKKTGGKQEYGGENQGQESHVAPSPITMSDTVDGGHHNASSAHNQVTDEKETEHDAGAESTSRQQPHVMSVIHEDPHSTALHKMGLLTAFAVCLHNFPEGLATFVSTLGSTSAGIGIAIAIAVHNIPEGICVALPIYYATGSKWKAFMWASISGISEPLGAVVGYFALYGDTSLSFAIVFALVAGMMVYISLKELIPMALRYDPKDTVSTTCVILGMAVMAASLLLFSL